MKDHYKTEKNAYHPVGREYGKLLRSFTPIRIKQKIQASNPCLCFTVFGSRIKI